ncbi:MAG: HAMP domain-containing protein [Bacteroidales bacterium]|nr:HAMP domain-containing protein [Bacteroidales bacterium]
MKNLNSIGLKISIPIIISTILFITGLIMVNNFFFIKQRESSIESHLNNRIIEINNNIDRVGKKALWISSSFANLDFVKKAYMQFNETGNLQKSSLLIENQMTKANDVILKNTKDNPKIHFHLPPARSFIRCWSLKRGDDISDFRNSVLFISENKTSVTGIEVGRGGFVIRGISPIFDSKNTYLGSVETLFPISSVITTTHLLENEEFAIFMQTDLLKIATGFLESTASNVTSEKPTIGNLILVQKTSSKFYTKKISAEELNKSLNNTVFFETDSLQYALFPIKDYAGSNVGVGVIQINTTNLLKSINQAKIINFIIGFIFTVLLIVLILLFVKIIITKPLKDVVYSMKKISTKQIDFQITKKRNDEIGELYTSINKINTNFKAIILNINDTATTVSDASNQLSSASQDISNRANEQATTTEEVATSMEQILAMISSNTQNAEMTEKSSTKSANEMKQSSEIFVKTINSVSEISEKILIISEIAGKTDVLSINAAIEAARAGETGKGFAVVAHEIRKLADKTKIASDEINKLSKNGQDISKIAGKKLENAIPEIIKSAELVNNIVLAGKEQQSGVENINISVQRLAEMTNQNSASAEEMSASAEQLSAQAEQLKKLISVFKIGNIKSEQTNFQTKKSENKTLKKQFGNENNGFKINLSKNNISDDEFETF